MDNKVKGDWVLDEIKLNAQIAIKTECKYEIDEMEWMDASQGVHLHTCYTCIIKWFPIAFQ